MKVNNTIGLFAITCLSVSCSQSNQRGVAIDTRRELPSPKTVPALTGIKGPISGLSGSSTVGVSGEFLCYFSERLVTGYSIGPGEDGSYTKLGWSVQERGDPNDTFLKSYWIFTTTFSMNAADAINGDRIAVLGIDSENRTVLQKWDLAPAPGGMAAGSWAYPPTSDGFSAEFMVPTTVKGGGQFIEPDQRQSNVIAQRVEVLREDFGMEPVSVAAFPDGETFFVLLRSQPSEFTKIVKVSARQSGPVVVTDVATSTTYPSLKFHPVISIDALLFARHGFFLSVYGGVTTDRKGVVTWHEERLTFEDLDGDGDFESTVEYANEEGFLSAYEGQLILRVGSIYK